MVASINVKCRGGREGGREGEREREREEIDTPRALARGGVRATRGAKGLSIVGP